MPLSKRRVASLLLAGSIACGVVASFSTTGCGSSSSSSDSTSSGSSGDSPCFDTSSFTPKQVSFSTDVLPIFQRSCGISSVCHQMNPPPAPNEPYLGPASGTVATMGEISTIIKGIVGVPAADEPDMDLVNPGHPEKSFMMYKLDATPNYGFCSSLKCFTSDCSAMATSCPCLTSMPQNQPQLSLDDRNTIRSWIANGAMND